MNNPRFQPSKSSHRLELHHHRETDTIWIGSTEHSIVYSLEGYYSALRGEMIPGWITTRDTLAAKIDSKDSWKVQVGSSVDLREAHVQKARRFLGLYTRPNDSVGWLGDAMDFAVFEAALVDRESHPTIVLPVSLTAVFRVLGHNVPIWVNNGIYKDAVIESDNEAFKLAGHYVTRDGRVVKACGVGLYVGSSHECFADQYGHYRYTRQNGYAGRGTGSDYESKSTVLPADRPVGLEGVSDELRDVLKAEALKTRLSTDVLQFRWRSNDDIMITSALHQVVLSTKRYFELVFGIPSDGPVECLTDKIDLFKKISGTHFLEPAMGGVDGVECFGEFVHPKYERVAGLVYEAHMAGKGGFDKVRPYIYVPATLDGVFADLSTRLLSEGPGRDFSNMSVE